MIFVQVRLQVHSSYIKHKQKILNEMPIMKNYILDCSQLKKETNIIWIKTQSIPENSHIIPNENEGH